MAVLKLGSKETPGALFFIYRGVGSISKKYTRVNHPPDTVFGVQKTVFFSLFDPDLGSDRWSQGPTHSYIHSHKAVFSIGKQFKMTPQKGSFSFKMGVPGPHFHEFHDFRGFCRAILTQFLTFWGFFHFDLGTPPGN